MIQVNALGDACPIPVVKTKNAIKELGGSGVVETLVDNEIAVQNLTKMANQKGYKVSSKKLSDRQYQVTMEIGENAADKQTAPTKAESETCISDARENTVVVIASATMGEGDPELGRLLMKGYLYALTQLDTLPKTLLFYNGGAALTCEGLRVPGGFEVPGDPGRTDPHLWHLPEPLRADRQLKGGRGHQYVRHRRDHGGRGENR